MGNSHSTQSVVHSTINPFLHGPIFNWLYTYKCYFSKKFFNVLDKDSLELKVLA